MTYLNKSMYLCIMFLCFCAQSLLSENVSSEDEFSTQEIDLLESDADAQEDQTRSCRTEKLCNLVVTNLATIKNLNVTGATNLQNNLLVGGATQLNNLIINGDFLIPGTVIVSDGLDVPGDLTVGGSEQIAGNLSVGGNGQVSGDLTVDGALSAGSGMSGTFKDTQFTIVHATDATKKLIFDVQGNPGTTTTIITNPTTDRLLTTTNYDGTLLATSSAGGQVFINSDVTLFASNAGIQYNTTSTDRAQISLNQFGANAGVPGIEAFKSRGATIGSLAKLIAGDVIYRSTSIGVTANLNIPISSQISINVSTVPAGQSYVSTDYELQLVSLSGPANGRRTVYKTTSEGVQQLLETTSAGSHVTVPSGLITLGAAGTVTVANTRLAANARIILTVQPGPAPAGKIYVSNITATTSFTVTSTAGAGDAGVKVYYQIYTPLP